MFREKIYFERRARRSQAGPTLITFFRSLPQALESTKSILNEDFLSSIDAYLAKECKILQQQWIGSECQESFKKHAVKGEW